MPRNGRFSIACVIQKTPAEFYGGEDYWDNNISRACLFAIKQAEEKLKEIRAKYPKASIGCVIQNKAFDYYDGQQFVYNLLEAKFYPYVKAWEIVHQLSEQPDDSTKG
ncbi:MAG TPA: hypothetical protein VL404_03185 [Candidatus Eisenbacteria bacterium]|jgi:hypothetical protein|nr:hypothetical protein [Candidatus Eisenbacteria bacterium]